MSTPIIASQSNGGLRRGLAARMTMFAGGKPTAKDYVQDGLIAMWDGIENAGFGAHKEGEYLSGNIWKSLVGTDTFQVSGTGQGKVYLTSDHFQKPKSYSRYLGEITPSFTTSDTTIQLVSSSQSGNDRLFVIRTPSVAVYCDYNQILVYGKISGVWKRKTITNTISPTFSIPLVGNGSIRISTVLLKESNLSIYDGETEKAKYDMSTATDVSFDEKVCLYLHNYIGANVYRYSIYDRALSATEIEKNNAIDKARFGLP